MKILYAIQGTGNGHLSRAREIIPMLQQYADVDLLISGTQTDVHLPHKIKYTYNGMSFVFGKNGGIDFLATFKQLNTANMIKNIAQLPVEKYNLILNDFEPVSAWACQQKNVPCVSLSHQSAVLNKYAPKPKKKDVFGKAVLKYYAPCTVKYGFHFESFDSNIFTPVIRGQVRKLKTSNQGHYTVYLPAYDDERILNMLTSFNEIQWQVFSKHARISYERDNVIVQKIDNENFIQSMASSKGVLCGAGFETPAEALFLHKKLAVIPMKMQYEQQCNAAALKQMGVPVFKSLKEKHRQKIQDWLENTEMVNVNYPDLTEDILQMIIKKHATSLTASTGKSFRLTPLTR